MRRTIKVNSNVNVFVDEEKPKKQKANYEKAIMMVPKINKVGIEIKPPLLVDLEITSKVVVSPNSNISSTATGKHLGDFKFNGGEMTSDEDKGGNGGGSCSDHRKKLRLGKAQIMVLEQAFREHTILNTVCFFSYLFLHLYIIIILLVGFIIPL